MSVFVQQQHSVCDFKGSDSWVILSEIEQSIKRKIEAVGTPLKDWDIQINYGIKTGYNDAFIITTEKRDEILANCADDDERNRTAELIRPILRGRDIKRYGYEWANLWLIATFPARQYDINNYPAVKNYLLSFAKQQLIDAGYSWVANEHLADYCKQKLSQTGKFIEIDGKRITIGNSQEKARKKTSNKWFETQDSISYWDDFNQPKIVWKRVGSILRFAYDKEGLFALDSTCFAIGSYVSYLVCILNSSMGHYLLQNAPKTGTGDLLISVQAIEPLLIPVPDNSTMKLLKYMVSSDEIPDDSKINAIIYEMYKLSADEIRHVEICVSDD